MIRTMLAVPQRTPSTFPPKNKKSISIRTADRKMLTVKSWVEKRFFSTAFFDSIFRQHSSSYTRRPKQLSIGMRPNILKLFPVGTYKKWPYYFIYKQLIGKGYFLPIPWIFLEELLVQLSRRHYKFVQIS